MKTILDKIAGFYEISVEEKSKNRLVNLLLRGGVVCRSAGDGAFILRSYEKRKAEKILSDFPYKISPVRGLPSAILRLFHHPCFFLSLALLLALFFFVRGRVCAIKYDGGDVSYDALCAELCEAGFAVGYKWKDTDLSAVESAVLSRSEKIGWVKINRQGAVAYVEIRPKILNHAVADGPQYANVTATADGVVEEITVRAGTPCVKVGDTVKAGQLLISGTVSDEKGTALVCADGDVYLRVYEKLTVPVSYIQQKSTVERGEVVSLTLRFFEKNANIYNKNMENAEKCDIIEKEYRALVGYRTRLPVSLNVKRAAVKTTEMRTLSPSETAALCSARHALLLRQLLADGDLVSVKTVGSFSGEGYTMESDVSLIRKAQKTTVIEVN